MNLSGLSLGLTVPSGVYLPAQVRAILEKYGSDAHLYLPGPQVPVLGPELVSNGGPFATTAGYATGVPSGTAPSLSIAGSSLRVSYSADTFGYAYYPVPTVVGSTYTITVVASFVSGGNSGLYLQKSDSGVAATNAVGSSANADVARTMTVTFTATATTSYFRVVDSDGGSTVIDIAETSVREILSYDDAKQGWHTGNYTDSAGTTPGYTDAPVGLVLDAQGSLGAELVTTPAGNNGWTPFEGGGTKVAGGALGSLYGTHAGNKMQKMVVTVSAISGTITPSIGNANPGSTITAVGTYTYYLSPTGGGYWYLDCPAATTCTVTISIREVTGIHCSQNTAANKPTLRRGLVAINQYSQDFSQWSTTAAGTLTTGQADPLGGTSATLFSGAGKNLYLMGPYSGSLANGTVVTQGLWCYSPTSGTLTIGSTNGVPGANPLITLSAGWGIYALTWTATENDGPVVILNGTLSSVTLFRTAIFQGTHTAAEILALGGIPLNTTAPASTALGPDYLQFDGDDSLGSTFAAGTLPADADVFMCVRRDTIEKAVIAYAAPDKVVCVIEESSAQVCGGVGSGFYVALDGVVLGSAATATRQQLHDATKDGKFHIVEFRNVDLSAWNNLTLANYSSWTFTGAVGPVLITSANSDADRVTIRKWLAKESGVTP